MQHFERILVSQVYKTSKNIRHSYDTKLI